jgi:hypothetical protein
MDWYSKERTHSRKFCEGRPPWQTFLDSKHLALKKQLDELPWREATAASSIGNHLLGTKTEGLPSEDDALAWPLLTQLPSDAIYMG